MPGELHQLYEKQDALKSRLDEMRNLAHNDDHDWTSENQENWDGLCRDWDTLKQRIEVVARHAQIQPELENRMEIQATAVHQLEKDEIRDEDMTPEQRMVQRQRDEQHTMRAWFKAGEGTPLSEEETRACQRQGLNPNLNHYNLNLRTDYHQLRKEFRQQSTAATEGGEQIPVGFVNNFEIALLEFGGVRQVADVMRTASGQELRWPTTNDTGTSGVLISENAAISTTDYVTSELILNAYKYGSNFIKVSQELMEDSAINVPQVVGRLAGERVGRIHNNHMTLGTGTGQPNGIVTSSTAGKTAASMTAYTEEELIDLYHSVDPAYRTAGFGWMMHDSQVSYIRQFRSDSGAGAGTGQFMWQDGMRAGEPDMLFGWPVTVNQDMESARATGDIVVLAGLFTKYKVRDVANFRMIRLDERFRDNDQTGFIALARMDADLLDAGTNPVKHLVLA